MKKILTLAVILAVCAPPVFAAENSKISAQGEKMKACAHEYKSRNLPKSEYKSFIKVCLKKGYQSGNYQPHQAEAAPAPAPAADKPQPPAPITAAAPVKLDPKEKMKKCNGDAQEQKLKGDDRKKFMRSCLSS